MPLHVRSRAGPIDHDEKLRQTRQPLPRERGIEVEAMRFEVRIAEQPIHAFDAVAHAGFPGRPERQGDKAQGTAVHRRDRHITQGALAPPACINGKQHCMTCVTMFCEKWLRT